MTQTPEREAAVSFTVPYQNVDEVIITRKELAREPWKGKTFHVQKDSSYLESLSEHPDWAKAEEVDPNLNAADIMELISLKKYDYTLASSFWAETISRRFGSNLTVLKERPFKRNVPISWAVRKNNPLLLKELNEFLPTVKNGTFLVNTYQRKYFRDFGRIRSRDFDLATSKLSRYDKTLKKYAEEFGFDWRFLAAVCYQESRFRQKLRNQWGAVGLFQIKQMTASEPYIAVPDIEGVANYENNIHAGVKYLAWIKKTYLDSLPVADEGEKLRMMLAAYNAGPHRLLQAIHRTKKEGLNPNRWFRNVELAMAKMGVPEPVIYVSEINKHYVSYILLGIH
jgi:membrane-bound lytic murein transglycosylase MltF